MTEIISRLSTALADRYKIEGELGAGGMATVYLAEDLKHRRQVAIKVLKPELAAVLGTERFVREIEITAKLTHPNILTLLDSGEANGFLYYVMPYVEGESLRERLNREGRLALEDALQIVREVADALHYAHRRGIVHRDVKPENILFEADHAVVTDFGIARAVSEAGAERLTGTGLAIGTPAYMSPEQATGAREVDARTDAYSLGCVLYEMLGGAPPFSGPTPQAILARKCVDPVPSLRLMRDTVPETVERVIMRALATAPGDRYSTTAEWAGALNRAYAEAVAPPTVPVSGWRLLVRSRTGLALVVLLLAVLSASAWLWVRTARDRWAFNRALPELQSLVDQRDFVAAYRLAQRAEPYLAQNPEFQRLWRESTFPVSIRTTPAGARVYIADYRAADGIWDFLGVSPIEETRIPAGFLRFKVEKAGYQPLEAAREWYLRSLIEFGLSPEDERPEMIRVPGGRFQFWLSLPRVQLESYWLDRHEVTNREFREFIDRGGYREPRFWTHRIVVEGREVPREQGITVFADRTGRPGPSTWELGSYPDGAGDFPVSGVSWYEAAAYCEHAGKQLPTIYHWYHAAGWTGYSDILPLSNLGTEGPAAVGTYRGVSPHGHYDMAGNVREWVLNPVGNRRYVLGGAWSDANAQFYNPEAASPGDRSPKNGIRCASYAPESAETLGADMDVLVRRYDRRPVDGTVFRTYRNLYAYAATPLNPRVESVDESSPHWRRETISFEAPYGDERVSVHLFLPKTGNPPYQAVVLYPSIDAYSLESSQDMHTWWFDFIVRTGRVVVHPMYEGMYGRPASALRRERVVHESMDIGRSIDYLEMRGDVDASKLAYFGFSVGALKGPLFTAIETRFKASVLLGGGLWGVEAAPEVEPANYAPRATVPVLMLNGRDDFVYPEPAARALFRLLGAPEHDKRLALVEGGHVPNDWQAAVKEILDWLDRYLGPVR
jgi:tRNA A-37 threonylcarbamoyl transferase component Bud32/predicted esterase